MLGDEVSLALAFRQARPAGIPGTDDSFGESSGWFLEQVGQVCCWNAVCEKLCCKCVELPLSANQASASRARREGAGRNQLVESHHSRRCPVWAWPQPYPHVNPGSACTVPTHDSTDTPNRSIY